MMHSTVHRGNIVVTFATTMLMILAVGNMLAGMWMDAPVGGIVDVLRVEQMRVMRERDVAVVAFSVSADLTPKFHWNTKQLVLMLVAEYETKHSSMSRVTIWDKIVVDRGRAALDLTMMRNKYPLEDYGRGLRGTAVNFTLYQDITPVVGPIRVEKIATTAVPFIMQVPSSSSS